MKLISSLTLFLCCILEVEASSDKLSSVCDKDYKNFQNIFYKKFRLSLRFVNNYQSKAINSLTSYRSCLKKELDDYWNLKRISSSSMKCWSQLDEEEDACDKIRYFMCYSALKRTPTISMYLIQMLASYLKILEENKKPDCSVLKLNIKEFKRNRVSQRLPIKRQWIEKGTKAPNPFISEADLEETAGSDAGISLGALNSIYSSSIKPYSSQNRRRSKTKCNEAPHYTPCISKTSANARFAQCCMRKKIVGCLPICSYDIRFEDLSRSVMSGMCSAYKMKTYLECASQGGDNSDCCFEMSKKHGVMSSTCKQFCAPDKIVRLTPAHRKCSKMIEPVMKCHLAGLK